jgi:hypothetical protein
MSRIQKTSDLHISGPEWTLAHLRNSDDYDRAEAALIDALAKIERDLAGTRAIEDPSWCRTAHRVKALKVHALEQVRIMRQQTWEATALQVLKDIDPVAYRVVEDATNELLNIKQQKAA